MNPIAAVEDWLLNKALGRAVVIVAQAAASYYAAHSGLAQSWGVTASIDPNILASAILGLGTTVVHWIGSKIAPKAPALGAALGATVLTGPAQPTPSPNQQGN